ncbi:hypothetical protein DFP72DRAFT_918914 [Ephemerocybe angulata]|uniref:Uncharacterized protein n=1 Tax=Ephemerocybe angulata TaxID=980116 RepID=A0A8H6LXK4_9AGAR|nr:hypothetical protein DFP72DRAFT_918914 [Tulosesus angulatus]
MPHSSILVLLIPRSLQLRPAARAPNEDRHSLLGDWGGEDRRRRNLLTGITLHGWYLYICEACTCISSVLCI